jgi:hypothetical protein
MKLKVSPHKKGQFMNCPVIKDERSDLLLMHRYHYYGDPWVP